MAARKKKSRKLAEGVEFSPTATYQDQQELLKALREQADRAKEALRVYKPLPFQERFHEAKARRVIIRKGNRVGGSLALFVEVARAVTGRDPHNKYPTSGTCVCLGWGERHIGTVIHRYLFRPGAFWMRQDDEGVWIPCDREDKGARESPPLIPEKYCSNWSWEKKSEHIFNRVTITHPDGEWEILACNSKGDPNMLQGINVNLYAIDEDIDKHKWYEEAMMRTTAVNGLLRWGALPQQKNDSMLHLLEEAEDEADKENPSAVCVTASMWDNPYTSLRSKQEDMRALSALGEEVAKRRISGEMDMSSRQMYPEFDKYRHSVFSSGSPEYKHGHPIHKITQAMKESNGPPHEWCRYATLDPGHGVFGILYWAVPPEKELGEFKIIYDESYIKQCDAHKFGREFASKVHPYNFQDWIIDEHGARLTSFDTGKRPRAQYEAELRANQVKCVRSGHGFSSACDVIEFRENALREWLRFRDDGTPTLLVVADRCPHFVRTMARFRKKTREVGGETIVLDEADRRRDAHLAETAEYGAAHGLPYVRPPQTRKKGTWFDFVMRGRMEREMHRRANGPRGQESIYLGARGS